MIDIHTHILPNYDDGCRTLEEARECLLKQKSNGVNHVILTPHFSIKDDKEHLIEYFEKFKKQVEDIGVNLYLGAEVMYSRGFIKALREKKVLTLNNSQYMLIEFEFFNTGVDMKEALYDVMCMGYKVILAHPERYDYLSINQLQSIKRLGVLFQVNVSSLSGEHGLKAKSKALELHKKGMIDILASDCHRSLKHRIPNLDSSWLKYENSIINVKEILQIEEKVTI
jgi:protein-tyrosine phosphatase